MTIDINCKICNENFQTLKGLSTHIQYKHKLTSEQYTIKYIHNEIRPQCKLCSEFTRYVSFEFKEYCKTHTKEACSVAGKTGGKMKKTWNKGLTKENDVRIYNQSLSVTGSANHFYGRKHAEDTKRKISILKTISEDEFNKRIDLRSNEFRCLSGYQSYVNRQHTKLKLECTKCFGKQEKTLQAYERGGLCIFCYPFMISKGEIQVGNYIESLGYQIKRNNRTLISPKELDIVVLDKNFAIEYNGLYWHDVEKVGKNHHQEKTKKCREINYSLFHIFSDEWENKSEILKSMISSRLRTNNIVNIDARKCSIVEIKPQQAHKFFDSSHISGNVPASKYFALEYGGDIVAAISWRIPQQKKKWIKENPDVIEIARYANKLYTNVRGGFSRLLKYSIDRWLIPETKYRKILSYCDLRFGYGNVYSQCGFSLIKEDTGINYWYTDGKVRHPRFKFRATKEKTEKQVAEENKVWKVFGCSNSCYQLII